jgi:hypothetical protein
MVSQGSLSPYSTYYNNARRSILLIKRLIIVLLEPLKRTKTAGKEIKSVGMPNTEIREIGRLERGNRLHLPQAEEITKFVFTNTK